MRPPFDRRHLVAVTFAARMASRRRRSRGIARRAGLQVPRGTRAAHSVAEINHTDRAAAAAATGDNNRRHLSSRPIQADRSARLDTETTLRLPNERASEVYGSVTWQPARPLLSIELDPIVDVTCGRPADCERQFYVLRRLLPARITINHRVSVRVSLCLAICVQRVGRRVLLRLNNSATTGTPMRQATSYKIRSVFVARCSLH